MNEAFKRVMNDKIARWGLMLSGSLLLLEIFYIGIVYFSLPPYIPIFNQLPWGDARLGPRLEIFLPFSVSLLFFLLNFYLISKIHSRLPLLSRMLSITTLLIAVLSLFFIVRTLQLII